MTELQTAKVFIINANSPIFASLPKTMNWLAVVFVSGFCQFTFATITRNTLKLFSYRLMVQNMYSFSENSIIDTENYCQNRKLETHI